MHCELCRQSAQNAGVTTAAKLSALGCGHKLCRSCLTPRVRIIRLDKIMVVKCPLHNCTAITVKALPAKYCSDVLEKGPRKVDSSPVQPVEQSDVESELVNGFGEMGNIYGQSLISWQEKLHISAILSFVVARIKGVISIAYGMVITALVAGYMFGFDRGYAYSLVGYLNHDWGRFVYPTMLALLLLAEAVPSAPAAVEPGPNSQLLLTLLDAATVGVLLLGTLLRLDFGYCHSLDRYLVMAVSTYFLPVVVVSAVAVQVARFACAAMLYISAYYSRLGLRIVSARSEPSPPLMDEQNVPPQREERQLVGTSRTRQLAEMLREGERIDHDVTVSSIRKETEPKLCVDTNPLIANSSSAGSSGSSGGDGGSARSSPSNSNNSSGGGSAGKARRVSFSLSPQEERVERRSEVNVEERVVNTTSSGQQDEYTGTTVTEEQELSRVSVGDTSAIVYSGAVAMDLLAESVLTDSSEDEAYSPGRGYRLDTTPRILSGQAPAGFRQRVRSPLWRSPAPAVAASGSQQSPAQQQQVVVYDPVRTAGLQLIQQEVTERECSTPTQRYLPEVAGSSSGGGGRGGTGSHESSHSSNTSTATVNTVNLTSAAAAPAAVTMCHPCTPPPHTAPRSTSSPSHTANTISTAGYDSLHHAQLPFDSPEDEFKLHSNIKLKPLGTFSAGRRNITVCDLAMDAVTPVEGYTHAYLLEAAGGEGSQSPPTRRKAPTAPTRAASAPLLSGKTVPPQPQPQPTAQSGAQKKAGGNGKTTSGGSKGVDNSQKPRFKSVFLNSGKAGQVR